MRIGNSWLKLRRLKILLATLTILAIVSSVSFALRVSPASALENLGSPSHTLSALPQPALPSEVDRYDSDIHEASGHTAVPSAEEAPRTSANTSEVIAHASPVTDGRTEASATEADGTSTDATGATNAPPQRRGRADYVRRLAQYNPFFNLP